jgi:hypothetical protein
MAARTDRSRVSRGASAARHRSQLFPLGAAYLLGELRYRRMHPASEPRSLFPQRTGAQLCSYRFRPTSDRLRGTYARRRVTSLPLSGTKEVESPEIVRSSCWIAWLPVRVLPLGAVAACKALPPWVFMWILSFAIFFSRKCLTWWRTRFRIAHSSWRPAGYPLAWPGMDAEALLHANRRVPTPPRLGSISETPGVILLGVAAHPPFPRANPLSARRRGNAGSESCGCTSALSPSPRPARGRLWRQSKAQQVCAPAFPVPSIV